MTKKVRKSHITKFLRSQSIKVPADKMNDIPWLREQVESRDLQSAFETATNILWIFEDDVPRETTKPKETPAPKEESPKKEETEEEPAPAPPTPTPGPTEPSNEPTKEPTEEPTEAPKEEPTETPDGTENVFERLDNARVEATIDEPQKEGLITITKEPEKPKRARKTRKKKEDISYIEGYILLVIADILFPTAFVFVFNMFSKKKKIEFGEMCLSEDEIEKLQPLADKAADNMQVKASPVVLFAISMSVVYAQKAVGIIYSKK